ncbi:MAG TPA: NAD(P)H-dependent oxidoreductase [Polyangiaceae bacterium]
MRAVLVTSAARDDIPMSGMLAVLRKELERAGFNAVDHFDVREHQLGYCQGEFDCWLKHPGHCKIHDGAETIAAAIARADAVVYASRVTFGGFDHFTKFALDRLLGLLLPFFEQRSELTHHELRYARRPRLHAVGMLALPDGAQAETFDALNDANAVNLGSPTRSAAVLVEGSPELWGRSLRKMLEAPLRPGHAIQERASLRETLLSAARPGPLPAFAPVRNAALLVGSAKPKGSSASELLAREVARLLAAEGVTCSFHRAGEFVHENDASLAAAREIAAADLFVLCSLLYVDSFPALVTHALELVSRVRAERRDALFVPLVQCGFPEPEHIRTALRVARHFAASAGYHYAGGLPLGAGSLVTPERSLAEGHPPLQHVARALRLAVPALAAGESVPEGALQQILKPAMPDAIYRMAGTAGFRLEARRRGASQSDLRARPFAAR